MLYQTRALCLIMRWPSPHKVRIWRRPQASDVQSGNLTKLSYKKKKQRKYSWNKVKLLLKVTLTQNMLSDPQSWVIPANDSPAPGNTWITTKCWVTVWRKTRKGGTEVDGGMASQLCKMVHLAKFLLVFYLLWTVHSATAGGKYWALFFLWTVWSCHVCSPCNHELWSCHVCFPWNHELWSCHSCFYVTMNCDPAMFPLYVIMGLSPYSSTCFYTSEDIHWIQYVVCEYWYITLNGSVKSWLQLTR